jgi:hypothetical protein
MYADTCSGQNNQNNFFFPMRLGEWKFISYLSCVVFLEPCIHPLLEFHHKDLKHVKESWTTVGVTIFLLS